MIVSEALAAPNVSVINVMTGTTSGELSLRPVRRSARRVKSDRSDGHLIERLKAGDEKTLEAIVNLHSAKLYNVALRILGDPADAEEVIQDVFWIVYRKANTFQGNSQLSTWLYRLTVNAGIRWDPFTAPLKVVPQVSMTGHLSGAVIGFVVVTILRDRLS